ncbi:MAG: FAD-binding oxidoreductase [Deltaproteobacteria bacterium]|nr:MAG: FAD-binding oxidoreductase [Deltaproteobacteria bacterium]
MESLQATLESIVGPTWVSARFSDRIAYSRDLWPKHLLEPELPEVSDLPLCIVWPGSVQQAADVIQSCNKAGVPFLPVGGSSSVTGAATPPPQCVLIDTKRLSKVRSIESENGNVTVEAGLLGGTLEETLQSHQLTLGHFPSSLHFSSVGGWVATRCAGQASARYGNIEDLVLGVEWVSTTGKIRWSYGSWDATPLLLGSEGSMGLITACQLKVFPQPKGRRYRGVLFPNLSLGLEAMRTWMQQSHPPPTVMRLYDPIDSLLSSHRKGGLPVPLFSPLFTTQLQSEEIEDEAIEPPPEKPTLFTPLSRGLGRLVSQTRQRFMEVVLRNSKRGLPLLERLLPTQAMMLLGYEESSESLAEQRIHEALRWFATYHGEDMGEEVGEHWYKHRYDSSFRQPQVFPSGAFADTLDVATDWGHLLPLYESVKRTLQREAWVQAQFTHPYLDGCSVSFSLTGVEKQFDTTKKYESLWRRSLSVVLASHATMSHQNGVGRLRTEAMPRELGRTEAALLRTVQECWQETLPTHQTSLLPSSVLSLLLKKKRKPEPVRRSRLSSMEHAGLHVDTQSMLMQAGGFHSLESIETFAQLHGMTAGFRTGWELPLAEWFAQNIRLAQRNNSLSPLSLCQTMSVTLTSGESLQLGRGPRSSTGPDLRGLFLGSFHSLGTLHQATLRLQRHNTHLSFGSFSFTNLEEACLTLRRLQQHNQVKWDGALLRQATSKGPLLFYRCTHKQHALFKSYFPKATDFREFHTQQVLPGPDARLWLSLEIPWSDLPEAWAKLEALAPQIVDDFALMRTYHSSGELLVQLSSQQSTRAHFLQSRDTIRKSLGSSLLRWMGSEDRWEDRRDLSDHRDFFTRIQLQLHRESSEPSTAPLNPGSTEDDHEQH